MRRRDGRGTGGPGAVPALLAALAGLVLHGGPAHAERGNREAVGGAARFEASFSAAEAHPFRVLATLPPATWRILDPASLARASLLQASPSAAPPLQGLPSGDILAGLPPVILNGSDHVPMPPRRPVLVPGAAAYASLGEDGPFGLLLPVVPRPVSRPASLDRPAGSPPAAGPQVAMLGGLPGAGAMIGAMADATRVAALGRGACSVAEPYRLTALGPADRTRLEPPALLDAAMVQHLVGWEARVQDAARRVFDQPVVALRVAASYDCRSVNHQAGAHLSEHAHANAIDISGYQLADGRWITVKADFHGAGPAALFLAQVHAATCDVFGVVLGPGSDGMHEDHFHMDLMRWKLCR